MLSPAYLVLTGVISFYPLARQLQVIYDRRFEAKEMLLLPETELADQLGCGSDESAFGTVKLIPNVT